MDRDANVAKILAGVVQNLRILRRSPLQAKVEERDQRMLSFEVLGDQRMVASKQIGSRWSFQQEWYVFACNETQQDLCRLHHHRLLR